MRVSGLFLSSRVARRVFAVLVLAAFVPLTLFATLAWQTLREQHHQQRERLEVAELQQIGVRLFDRLEATQAALAALAVGSDRFVAGPPPQALQSMLRDAATVPAAGGRLALQPDGLAADEPSWVQRWRALDGPAAGPGPRTLWWLPAQGEQAAQVIVGHFDEQGRAWWLGVVAPDYLWDDFLPGGPAEALCISASDGAWLHCPNELRDGMDRGGRERSLFLGARFSSPDWRMHAPPAGARGASWGTWIAADQTLQQPMKLALVASALLTAVLSMMIVRRTMVPLDVLTRATRRLTEGHWATRVALPANDEFGELARSFNGMAARIDRQIQSLELHAAIDRAILDGNDVDTASRRVLARMAALLPQATVAVAVREPSGEGWRVLDGVDAPLRSLRAVDLDLHVPADGPALRRAAGQVLPAWAATALGAGAEAGRSLCWLAAHWRGRLLAVLIITTPRPILIDAASERELQDLRDRLAVCLAAAAREHKLRDKAVRDSLTGLANRAGLRETGAAMLRAHGDACSMAFIDLDGFKTVNDSLGHAAGDELLCLVAARLRRLVPAHALLARPGGDEFVIMLPGPAIAVQDLAQAVCACIAEPFALREQTMHIGASVGIACCPDDAGNLGELMRCADLAMYDAKGAGRGTWRRFGAAMSDQTVERVWLVGQLRRALEGSELQVHYQPRVSLEDGSLCGAEALVRWQHAQRGAIAPGSFIPVAEDSGLIEPLGRFVLDRALQSMRSWRDAGAEVARTAVNVSARQLRDPAFAETVFRALARHRLRPTDLELELTESLFVGDADNVCAMLAPLRERGVVVALDDFGTGYSSLAALHRLPVDVLKIDRSFVAELGQRASADAVVRSVIALARALGKRVVAEGVETAQQHERLRELGCDEGQGWLYARAMPGPELLRYALGGEAGQRPAAGASPSATAEAVLAGGEPGAVHEVGATSA